MDTSSLQTGAMLNAQLNGGNAQQTTVPPSIGYVFQNLDGKLGTTGLALPPAPYDDSNVRRAPSGDYQFQGQVHLVPNGDYEYKGTMRRAPNGDYVGTPIPFPAPGPVGAPTPTPTPPATQPPTTQTPGTYCVKSGDYLYAIAAKELGDPNRWTEIASLNNISAPYTIYPGQVLKLPTSVQAPQPQPPVSVQAPQPQPPAPATYTVQSGDYLYAIAAKELGDANRWTEIASLNNISAPYTIYSGQVLKLPGATA